MAIYYRKPSDDINSAMSNRQLEYTMKLEQVYRQRVLSLLTPILGAGNITAQVNVDVDFTTQNITEEVVDPEASRLEVNKLHRTLLVNLKLKEYLVQLQTLLL
ncbi:MAG: hypothetical protein CM15mP20_1460 [Alphaproteobacteria bacterium]|nr:MAG: hypothetical protein CM15mP20_1460 [Alphaproteobacteria bacterium]